MWVIDSEKRVFSAAFFRARLAAPNSGTLGHRKAVYRYAKFLLRYLFEVSHHPLHIPGSLIVFYDVTVIRSIDGRFMLCSSQIEEAIN